MTDSGQRKYRAFFSYSRGDDRLAGKLHRALDSYKVPKQLRGAEGSRGTIPQSLHPIFRDRDDLSGGGQLDERLQAALNDSDALIVLCTPNSANSHWVNQEILTFQQQGREADIFPVIGAGDPNAANPEEECLPPALRDNELLAADLRNIEQDDGRIIGDGFEGGKLKLIAGLLGVDLDQLRRREDKRKRRLLAGAGAAVLVFLALAVLSGILGVVADRNAEEAEAQRLVAEANAERAERGELAAQRNEARAVRGERLAQQRAEAEKQARAAEAEQRRRADEQRLLAERNAAEAERQAGIARTNQRLAEAETAKAQLALAEALTQGARLAVERGNDETALRMALASGQMSPGIANSQRVLLTRLTREPELAATVEVPRSDDITFLAVGPGGDYAMTSGLALTARLFAVASGEQVVALGLDAGGSSGMTKGSVAPQTRGRVTRRNVPNSRGRAGVTRGTNADPAVGGTRLDNNWFNRDGSLFLNAFGDGTFEVRRTATGELDVPPVQAHAADVLSASFSPDGRYILTSSLDETARIWRVGPYVEAAPPLRVRGLRSAAWGADGRSIVTMSIDDGLQVWQDGRSVLRVPNSRRNSGALAIAADQRRSVEIDQGGTVRLTDLDRDILLATLATGRVANGAFAISGNSQFAAIGRRDGTVVVWDIATRQKLAEFEAHRGTIAALSLDRPGSVLGTVSKRGELKLWDLSPLFQPLETLVADTCRDRLPARSSFFSEDERAADPMLEALPGGRSVCPGTTAVARNAVVSRNAAAF